MHAAASTSFAVCPPTSTRRQRRGAGAALPRSPHLPRAEQHHNEAHHRTSGGPRASSSGAIPAVYRTGLTTGLRVSPGPLREPSPRDYTWFCVPGYHNAASLQFVCEYPIPPPAKSSCQNDPCLTSHAIDLQSWGTDLSSRPLTSIIIEDSRRGNVPLAQCKLGPIRVPRGAHQHPTPSLP